MDGIYKKDIKFVLEQEIGWCVKNRDIITKEPKPTGYDTYQNGFIAGLEQAKDLINKMPASDN